MKRTDRDFDNLMRRVEQLESRVEQPAAHIAAPTKGAAGGGVFPVIVRSNNGTSAMTAQRVRYKSDPPVPGDVETIGDPFAVYPMPYSKYSNYNIPGLVIVDDPPAGPWFKPWTAVAYTEGDKTFIFLPLKASPTGRILKQPVNTTSEFSGAS